MKAIEGRVWKFGDNISTDLLMPSCSTHGKVRPSEMKYYCMQSERPEFAENVKAGDIVVGGRNFGCGSSRPAMRNLMALGVACVVAESVSTLFFRNSLSAAFPILICEGVTRIFEEGDVAQVLLATGEVHNATKGITLQGEPYPPFLLRIVEEGGILEIFRQGKLLSDLT
ncbi:MAG: 3-isopropylmalate dehydratase [Dehalococcoidia bacterium]|nr:3-isopropylmalate dehydratase [Dehalococcoidia bacterium]